MVLTFYFWLKLTDVNTAAENIHWNEVPVVEL